MLRTIRSARTILMGTAPRRPLARVKPGFAYIQTRILPKLAPGVGLGDHRGPAPNDPKATYRQEIQLVVTPGSAPQLVKNDAGISAAISPLGYTALKGKSETTVSAPTTDKNGTEHFNVSSVGKNGLAIMPGAPKDQIQTSVNFAVTSDGKVGLDAGGMRTAYPSIEIYAYGADGSVRTIYQKTESGNVDDLKRKDQAIPAVTPRYENDGRTHYLLGCSSACSHSVPAIVLSVVQKLILICCYGRISTNSADHSDEQPYLASSGHVLSLFLGRLPHTFDLPSLTLIS